MHILHICAYTWSIGGPARVIYDLCHSAIQENYAVDILSPVSPEDEIYPAPAGVNLIICNRTTPISKIYREFSMDMLQYLRNNIDRYDIIHVHGIWHFGSLAPFLFKRKASIIITIHGLLDTWAVAHHKWKKDLVSFLYQKRLLIKSDLIHIFNNEEEKDLESYLGFKPRNIIKIPNGIRLEDYNDQREKGAFISQFPILQNKKVILFMSRLNVKKGLDLLLPAFQKYNRQFQDSILVLAGPDDGYENTARQFIADNQMENEILLPGMLTGELKKAALRDADVFVLPSYSEGFSIAVLEAMASGLACIVSDKVGFAEYIEQYDSAAITPVSVEGLTIQLKNIMQNDSLRTELAEKAYKMVVENFDIRIIANQMLKAYSELRQR
jgi:glycosyltransferase involved in cell wall biosynthesis